MNNGVQKNIDAVRAFNRFYTRQIGVLNEHPYSAPFSLSEVRVFYELANRKGPTARELSKELGLDPGYLSRMLRQFENRRLLRRAASRKDRRQQYLFLTKAGRRTFTPLDRRSSEQVNAMLKRLAINDQKALVHAMHEIQNVLDDRAPAANAYVLRQHQPGDMGWVTERHGALYWQEYRYDERFEALVARITADFILHLDARRERCWIAEKDGERVGCIFLVRKSKTVAKLRLLLVEPPARGLGIGKRLVSECIRFARECGYKKIMLWTQSELYAARHLYQEAGFMLVARQRHDSWSRRGLVAETWALKL